MKKVEGHLLLLFNHFSLVHEENSLNPVETTMLTNVLALKDSEDLLKAGKEKNDPDMRRVPGSRLDLLEAVNHIAVSHAISKIMVGINVMLDEDFVLQLHKLAMDGLLAVRKESGTGEC